MGKISEDLLMAGNNFATATKSCVDLSVNPNASPSDRKAALFGALGIGASIGESVFATKGRHVAPHATGRTMPLIANNDLLTMGMGRKDHESGFKGHLGGCPRGVKPSEAPTAHGRNNQEERI